MLRLSKKTGYALMAMKHLASDPRRRAASARDVADSYDIPIGLRAKVLTRLIRSGLLVFAPRRSRQVRARAAARDDPGRVQYFGGRGPTPNDHRRHLSG